MLHGSILIVEDNPSVCAGLRRLLRALFGWHVDIRLCQTINAALEFLSKESVNVVLTDMRLPHGTGDGVEDIDGGYDILRTIKKRYPTTKVIVHTAYDSIEDAVRCMRAGCFDYVPKPIVGDYFHRTLREAFELSKAQSADVVTDRESLTERLIISDWHELERSLPTSKKGIVLESLCSSLLVTVPGWDRVDSRVRSKTEEIDLVIQNESSDEFW